MKREEIKTGEIYFYKYDGNNCIFRATKDLLRCTDIEIGGEIFTKEFYDYNSTIDDIRETTQEEKMWLEYCELCGEFRPLEEAIENSYAKQFVEQYLTEQ